MTLDKNQFQDNSLGSQHIDDQAIDDTKVALAADIQQSKINGLPATLSQKVNKTGDTLTDFLTLSENPTQPTEIATKQYVDNQLLNSVTGVGLVPKIIIISNKATVSEGSLIFDSLTVQNILSPTDVLFNSSNIEGNSSIQINTDYYLYATGTGFIWSTSAPISFKFHPTQNWQYLAWSRTDSSSNLLPLRKHGSTVTLGSRVQLFSLSGPTSKREVDIGNIVPPFNGIQAVVSFDTGVLSGTTQGYITTQANFGLTIETSAANFYSWNGTTVGYTHNNIHAIVPLDSTNKRFYFSQTDSHTITAWMIGFLEG